LKEKINYSVHITFLVQRAKMESLKKYQNISLMLVFVLCVFFVPDAVLAQSKSSLAREGNKLYDKKDFKEAEIKYRKALEKDPKFEKAQFNLSDALYKQNNYEESAKAFDILSNSTANKDIKAKSYHNLGNSLLKSGKYKESIDAYKKALRLKPNDEDTRYNLEYARQKMIVQQNQQKQKQDQKKDQKQDKKDNKENKEGDQKKDNKDSKQDKQGNNEKKDEKNDAGQEKKPQPKGISKEQAERMLDALKNDEKKTLEKVKKEKALINVKVEKDW